MIIKLVTDFTSIVQFRHPQEVGGVYWIFNFLLTMGSLPAAIMFNEAHQIGESGTSMSWAIVTYLIPFTLLSFSILLYTMERRYLITFWSLERGKDLVVRMFREGNDSQKAFFSLVRSRRLWGSIEGEVKNWVESNWESWETEQPEWLPDSLKANVPVEFIPVGGGARGRESMRRSRVDAKGEGGLIGGLRASMRVASIGAVSVAETARELSAGLVHSNPKHMGKDLGTQLLLAVSFRKKRISKERAVRSFIMSQHIMKGVAEKHMFFVPMLAAVVKNKLVWHKKVNGKAAELDENDGRKIGESLARSLAVNTEVTTAVDAWIGNFFALKELDDEYDWFRPMVETISYRLLEEVPWGLKARVTVGAITSMTDLLTDIYITYIFWSGGEGGYFKASLASLMTSIGLQVLAVFFQNRKLGKQRVFRECLPILFGYKPAVDAYRVATGAKQEVGTMLPPLMEVLVMKIVEMFAEAIPGVIIQLTAIATNDGEVVTAAWISLAVSALTTGFASATITYDFDTSPNWRASEPDFYGLIPAKASKRVAVFVAMVLFTSGMLLIRSMTIVVLGIAGGSKWVTLFLGVDLSLYIAVKIQRGDFWCWIPVKGKAEIVSSILYRVLEKVVIDFTSIVQFRYPQHLGGLYWVFGVILTLGSLPAAIVMAEPHLTERPIFLARTVVWYFIPGSIAVFAIFLLLVDKKYLHTFLSTQRAKDNTMAQFLDGNSDDIKFRVMGASKHHWSSIEEKVKEWVGKNWAKWEEEQPEWFTDQAKAFVPEGFIPTAGDARRRESERRASVDTEPEGGLGGALRASIRRASIRLGDDIDRARIVPIEEDN